MKVHALGDHNQPLFKSPRQTSLMENFKKLILLSNNLTKGKDLVAFLLSKFWSAGEDLNKG